MTPSLGIPGEGRGGGLRMARRLQIQNCRLQMAKTPSLTLPRHTGGGNHAAFRLMVSASVGNPLVPYLRKHLRGAHRILKPPLVELSLALVGDRVMSNLHQQFMGV